MKSPSLVANNPQAAHKEAATCCLQGNNNTQVAQIDKLPLVVFQNTNVQAAHEEAATCRFLYKLLMKRPSLSAFKRKR